MTLPSLSLPLALLLVNILIRPKNSYRRTEKKENVLKTNNHTKTFYKVSTNKKKKFQLNISGPDSHNNIYDILDRHEGIICSLFPFCSVPSLLSFIWLYVTTFRLIFADSLLTFLFFVYEWRNVNFVFMFSKPACKRRMRPF